MKYLLAKARNTRTGQTLKQQDLVGGRFTENQRAFCQAQADILAEKMTARTGDSWVGFCAEYTPSVRRRPV